MRILHLIHRYAPAIGGAERYLGAVSKKLVEAGHEVTVATSNALDFERVWQPAGRQIAARTGQIDGVTVHYFPVRHLPAPRITYPGVRLLAGLLARSDRANDLTGRLTGLTPRLPALNRWLAEAEQTGRFDLVAGMGITFEGLMACGLNFAHRQQIPFMIYPLTHLGAGRQPGKDRLSRFYTLPHQIALVARSEAVMAMTEGEASFYRQHGVAAERLYKTGPGIDPVELGGGNGQKWRRTHGVEGPMILTLGGQSVDKGTPDVIKALRLVWQAGHRATLVIAGAKSPGVAAIGKQLDPEERRFFIDVGQVDDQQKKDLLAAADIFCLPSRTESFGIVYLEAWLYRLPIVAADAWGIKQGVIEHEKDGLLVPFGQPTILARGIGRLLENPILGAALGKAGYDKVMREHTWAVKWPRTLAVYEKIFQEGRAR